MAQQIEKETEVINMADYVEAARLEQLLPGKSTCVTIAGKDLALFNVDGTIYAIDDGCLHHGASLGTSKLEGKIVTCNAHGWKYDVTTGSTVHVPGYGVKSYPVRLQDGRILIDVA